MKQTDICMNSSYLCDIGDGQDIAETFLFWASKQVGMITGQVIKVSGGKAL